VIAHTDNIQVPGWAGAGYVILDPDTGIGAWKISGGGNGGYSSPWEDKPIEDSLGFVLGVLINTATSPLLATAIGDLLGKGMNVYSAITYALDIMEVYRKCGLQAMLDYAMVFFVINVLSAGSGAVLAASFGRGVGTVIGLSMGFVVGLLLSAYMKDAIMSLYRCNDE